MTNNEAGVNVSSTFVLTTFRILFNISFLAAVYHLHSILQYACLAKSLCYNHSNPPLRGQDISLSVTFGKVAYR